MKNKKQKNLIINKIMINKMMEINNINKIFMNKKMKN